MNRIIIKITRALLALATLLWLPVPAFAAGVPEELTETNPRVHAVIAVQNKVTKELLAIEEILGAGLTVTVKLRVTRLFWLWPSFTVTVKTATPFAPITGVKLSDPLAFGLV